MELQLTDFPEDTWKVCANHALIATEHASYEIKDKRLPDGVTYKGCTDGWYSFLYEPLSAIVKFKLLEDTVMLDQDSGETTFQLGVDITKC